MSTSNGKSYPKGTASTCHDVSMTQVSETPKGVSPIITELVALVQNSEPARQVIGMLEGKHQSSMGVLWSRSFRGPLPAP